jgi:flotillin
VKRARQVEEIDREKEVETLRIDKEKALEIERKNIAEVQRERIMVEKGVAEEEELIKDLRVVSEANRQKDELVIKAKGEAEQALVKDIESAKAQEQAAEHIARKMQTIADAELKAASKQAESKKILAEGNQAEASSQGLAEAQITLAQADAHERQGEAEAKTLELKLTAEAKGIQEKALAEATGLREKQDVLNAMSEQAREFETFGLRLNQERELTLAKLENSVALAEKQAGVLATALSEANINIMGGDGEFLRQFMNSITVGKSIDGLVNESETVKTLFKDHLNGDRNIMDDLGGVLAGAAQTSETMKNFNMSKLLSTLNNADDTQKGALASLLNLANKNSSDEK